MAYPITPLYATSSNRYACGIDYHRKEYVIGWSGPWQTPSLVGFPQIQDLAVRRVCQSIERQRYWQHENRLTSCQHISSYIKSDMLSPKK